MTFSIKKMKTDFTKLVPEITKWNNGQGVSISDWIQMMGDYAHAVGYSLVFWPSFIEKDGCVFREDVANYNQCSKACSGNRQAIESTVNHIHLCDLHCNDTEGNTPERMQYLASILKEIYTCKLERDFPHKTFTVEVYDDPSGPILTFFQDEKK